MSITWRIPPETLLDEVERSRVENAVTLLKLDSAVAVDSYEMAPDGPHLSSIFLINDSYIVELKLNGPDLQFDVAPSKLLANYRVNFDSVPAPTVDAESLDTANTAQDGTFTPPSPRKVPFVSVRLRHTSILMSQLNYFGDDLEIWLRHFMDAYPPSNLLHFYKQDPRDDVSTKELLFGALGA